MTLVRTLVGTLVETQSRQVFDSPAPSTVAPSQSMMPPTKTAWVIVTAPDPTLVPQPATHNDIIISHRYALCKHILV
jgi:hypothetical protein